MQDLKVETENCQFIRSDEDMKMVYGEDNT